MCAKLTDKPKVILSAIVVNSLLFIAKIVLGILGKSQALVADAFDTLSDMAGDLIIFGGLIVSEKPADEDHPYGHRKIESIVVGIVGFLIILVVILIAAKALYSIVHRIKQYPSFLALVGAILSIVVKEFLYRFLKRRGEQYGNPSIIAASYHARADMLSSVASSAGIGLSMLGWSVFDPVVAFLICVMISRTAIKLIGLSYDELVDKSISLKLRDEIIRLIKTFKEVQGVHSFRARSAGGRIFVDTHIQFVPVISLKEAHSIAHKIKDAVKEKYPVVEDFLIHIEPDPACVLSSQELEAELRQELSKIPEIKSYHGFMIMHSGSESYACIDAEVVDGIGVREAHSIARKVEEILKKITKLENAIVHIDVEGGDEDNEKDCRQF